MAIRVLTFFILLALSVASIADLTPLNDSELSAATGQAFIQFDRTEDVNGLDFTKVTFGLEAETSINADLVDFGNYERDGQAGSDIRIRDFALGGVNGDGSIDPFRIQDPFIEVAFDTSSGRQDVVGVRFGFGGAAGALSGTIESLTGNVNVNIADFARNLDAGPNPPFLARTAATLFGFLPVNAQAQLINDSGPNIGSPNNIRATSVGIVDGNPFTLDLGFFGDFNFSASDCAVLGIPVCFDLESYNTLNVGELPSNTDPSNPPPVSQFGLARGLFLSFQSQEVIWTDGNSQTTATSGAFFNIPNGGLNVNLTQALAGTDRIRTKLLDPYFD